MSVLATAPAACMPKGLPGETIHYRAAWHHDFVPLFDIIGASRAGNTITNLKSHPNAPMLDHTIMSPTYEGPLFRRINNFVNRGKIL